MSSACVVSLLVLVGGMYLIAGIALDSGRPIWNEFFQGLYVCVFPLHAFFFFVVPLAWKWLRRLLVWLFTTSSHE